MNFKQFISRVYIGIYWKLKSAIIGKYQIGKYNIRIPANFALPVFQKQSKLYDRFLPVLAKHLSSNKIIIDVGANIGDTALAILQQCKNPIICIEPSDVFFPYLEENLKLLSPEDFKRVKTIKKFVGTGKLTGELKHSVGGTAKIEVTQDSNTITHISLDKLIDDKANIMLLKVDTDGFDFDVISSADKVLSESQPVLFWENEITEDFQSVGFNEMYSFLTKKGYKYVYIFDNFGNLVTEETSFETLKNINSYAYSMKKYGCARTLYYTDVLATTEKNLPLVKQAIADYKNEWINK